MTALSNSVPKAALDLPASGRAKGLLSLLGIGFIGSVAFSITVAAWHSVGSSEMQRAQASFDASVQQVTASINDRMATYEQVLRGAVALFNASESVERREWRAYVRSLQVESNYPGILGVGFAPLVPASRREAFVRQMQTETSAEYRIWPDEDRSEYIPVAYYERFATPNRRVFGFDLLSEPTRREAVESARDSGSATLTGLVTLKNNDRTSRAGLLMFLPVYHRDRPLTTDAERRAALAGIVHAPFRVSDLMRGILGSYEDNLAFEVRDGAGSSNASLLHRSSRSITSPRFSRTQLIQLYGRTWTLRIDALPEFEAGVEHWKSRAVLMAGIGLSFMLMVLMWAAKETRIAALRLAGEMTAALRASEAKYRAVVEDQTELVCRFRPGGILSFVNDAYCRHFGRGPEGLLGTSFLRLIPETEHAAVMAPINTLTAADPTATTEQRELRPDGQVCWHQWTYRALYDAEGRLLEYQAVGRDITEQKRAEQALRESRALLRAAIDAAPATISVRDRDGRYVLANAALANNLCQSVDAFPGRTAADFYPESVAATLGARDAEIIATGEPSGLYELEAADAAGRVTTWLANAVPLRDDAGAVKYIVSVGLDITKRKQAEEALRESRALFRAVIDAMPATIHVKDRKLRYVLVNQVIASYHNLPVDAFPGKGPADFYPAARAAEIQARDARILATGEPVGLHEEDYTEPDGRVTTWLSTSVPLRDHDGAVKYVVSIALDITQRKQTEQALRESRALLRAVIDAVPATIRVRDRDGRYVLVNQALAGYYNVPVDAFPGKRASDFLPADYAANVLARDARIIATGEPVALHEVHYTENDGRITTWLSTAVPLRDDSGAVKYIVSVALDITQRKHAERALAESERKYRQLVETQTELITRFRPDTALTFANPAFCRYHSRSLEGLLGQQWLLQVHEEDRAAVQRFLVSLTPDAPSGTVEHRVVLADGEVRWQQWSDTAWFDADGRPLEYQSVGRDITERKLTEEKLRESERRMRHLVESAGVLPYTWDIDAQRYSYIGPQIEQLFGLTVEQWTNPAIWMDTVHPDDRERVYAWMQDSDENLHDSSVEYRLLRPDASIAWVREIIKVETDQSGRKVGYGTVVDVTDGKLRDGQLMQAQKMEAVGQLTSGIAHDFNNLLMIVIGNLDLLLPRLDAEDALARELAEGALNAGLDGAELTKQLLTFARKQPMQSVPIDLNDLVTRSVGLLRRTLGEIIDIDTDLAPDLWLIESDPAQLEAALANLAINARDAMAMGGRLTIATDNVRIGAESAAGNGELKPGDYVMVTVSDTGSGIAPEIVNRVFEPFFTTKETGKGSGLGLSMIYGFAKQSNGHVDIESQIDVGTSVRLYLPRTTRLDRLPAEVSDDEPAEAAGELILVVEDNATVRKSVVTQLQRLGYRTVEAGDGESAIAILERDPRIDLLFSDVVIPGGISGRQLAAATRRKRPDVKILLTSGFPDKATDARAGDRTEAMLSKPYRQQDLARKLREILGA